jgi:prolyl-tRNA synthetase
MPALTPIANWEKTGRADVDIAYKPDEKTVLGWSHEEMITPIAKQRIQSYRDLPFAAYQIQTKFRNEPRAKSGLLRGREFGMKDMYSFHASQADLDQYYERVKQAYFRVFERCGLKAYLVEAGGGEFTKKRSHEFQVLTEAGEDRILVCEKCNLAWNDELAVEKCEKCGGNLQEEKGAEVGNIFDLGQKFALDFDVKFTGEDGQQQTVVMGCYGIGISRLVATIAEIHHDDSGLIWPTSVAPFTVHLISLGKDEAAAKEAEKIYKALIKQGVEVLWDDREKAGAGEKFADADLIGCPVRIVVSPKTIEAGGLPAGQAGVELKLRSATEAKIIPAAEIEQNLPK